jgi:hypothetical protein
MISGNTQCYHHVPLIMLVVIAGTDKERPGCTTEFEVKNLLSIIDVSKAYGTEDIMVSMV